MIKLFVLAGLEMTNFEKRIHDMTLTGGGSTQRTIDTLITSDINSGVDKSLSNPWVGYVYQREEQRRGTF